MRTPQSYLGGRINQSQMGMGGGIRKGFRRKVDGGGERVEGEGNMIWYWVREKD